MSKLKYLGYGALALVVPGGSLVLIYLLIKKRKSMFKFSATDKWYKEAAKREKQ